MRSAGKVPLFRKNHKCGYCDTTFIVMNEQGKRKISKIKFHSILLNIRIWINSRNCELNWENTSFCKIQKSQENMNCKVTPLPSTIVIEKNEENERPHSRNNQRPSLHRLNSFDHVAYGRNPRYTRNERDLPEHLQNLDATCTVKVVSQFSHVRCLQFLCRRDLNG